MLSFQEQPDSVFLAILHEALEFIREVELVQFHERYQPTRAERQELDGFTKEARKIAARLKPDPADLRVVRMSPKEIAGLRWEPSPTVPSSGYVGPYPLREADTADATGRNDS